MHFYLRFLVLFLVSLSPALLAAVEALSASEVVFDIENEDGVDYQKVILNGKCQRPVIGRIFKSCRHPLNQPIYKFRSNEPKCGVETISHYKSDPSCRPIWKSCTTEENGTQSEEVVKTHSYISKDKRSSGTTDASCELFGTRYTTKLNSTMTSSQKKDSFGHSYYWKFDSYRAYYEDTRSVIGNVLVKRDYLCEVNLHLIEVSYKYAAHQSCGLFDYEECLPVYKYISCRLPEFGIETYANEPRPECGSTYEIKNETSTYHKQYCSSCDHIEVKDRPAALEKYICILRQAKVSAVQGDNSELRSTLLREYLPNLSLNEMEKIFDRVISVDAAYLGLNYDLKYLSHLIIQMFPKILSNENISIGRLGLLFAEHDWESFSITTEQLIATEKIVREKASYVETKVIFSDFITRLYLARIFHAEADLTELNIIKLNIDQHFALGLATTKSALEEIEKSGIFPVAKKEVIDLLGKYSKDVSQPLVEGLLGESIKKMSQRIVYLNKDFEDLVFRFQMLGNEFGFLKIYQGVLEFNGDLLQREVYRSFVAGEASVPQAARRRLGQNIQALLRRRTAALRKLLELYSNSRIGEESKIEFQDVLLSVPIEAQGIVLKIIDGSLTNITYENDDQTLQKAFMAVKQHLVIPFLEAEANVKNSFQDLK